MITSYICYIEEHIQELCEEVGLDLDFKNLFLAPHVKELGRVLNKLLLNICVLQHDNKKDLYGMALFIIFYF